MIGETFGMRGTSSSARRAALHALAVVSLLLASLLVPRVAHATVSISPDMGIDRSDRQSTLAQYQFYISRADCESTDTWTIDYQLDNFSGKVMEVWVGENADCRAFAARDPSITSSARCTKVAESGDPGGTNGNGTGSIDVTSAAIAGALYQVEGCVDSSSNTSPRSISLFIMLLNAANDDVDESNSYQFSDVRVDLLGPNPPSNVTATPLDQSARLSYSVINAVDDVKGYAVFCAPAGASPTTATSSGAGSGSSSASASSGGTGGAGGGGEGGGGGGSSSSSSVGVTTSASTTTSTSTTSGGPNPSCPSDTIVAGAVPPSSSDSNGDGTGSSVVALDLQNGETYACAVAATDDLDNVGVLSAVVCVTPVQSDDFFETYCKERGDDCVDGPGGCALCSVGSARETDRTPLFGLFAALLAAVVRKLGRK